MWASRRWGWSWNSRVGVAVADGHRIQLLGTTAQIVALLGTLHIGDGLRGGCG